VPPVAQAPAQQPAAPPKPAAEAPKPAAEAPKPAAEAPKPAAEAPKPAAEAPQPPPPAPKPAAPVPPKPAAKKAAPAPEPSIIDEFLDNPMYLGLLGALVVLLVAYFVYSWRRKKNAQARFQDSVLGAAAAGGASLGEPTAPPTTTTTSTRTASQAPAGMEAEEVDPIAEADVYMAYGRDAQAEEILKEALQRDANRTAVHGKLLEIYAHRKDTGAFAQSATKLRSLTNGTGPEWEKAAALGRSIDPRNNLYGGGSGAAEPSPARAAPSAPAAAVPTLDFDLGGTSQVAAQAPDISFDEPAKDPSSTGVDLDLGATRPTLETQKLPAMGGDDTLALGGEKSGAGGLDFNLDLGAEEKKPAPAAKPSAPETSGGLDFDLNLDLDKKGEPSMPAEPSKVDLADISLDLGGPSEDATLLAKGGADPKWQEVATKLDLAKAYEEMGDKDGARELLKEVMKDGDAAQRGTAEQLLAKLG